MDHNCIKAEALFDASFEGALSDEEKQFLTAHLEACERCRQDYALHRAMTEALREPSPEPPAELHDAVMAKIKDTKRRAKILRTFTPIAGTCAAALLCFAVLRSPMSELFGRTEDLRVEEDSDQAAVNQGDSNVYYSSTYGKGEAMELPDAVIDSTEDIDSSLTEYETADPNIRIFLYADSSAAAEYGDENARSLLTDLDYSWEGECLTLTHPSGTYAVYTVEENHLTLTESTIPELTPKG